MKAAYVVDKAKTLMEKDLQSIL